MDEVGYKVGTNAESWRSDQSQTITFIVTEDCNLRCKYCYITHKTSNNVMDFEVAKEFIDYILTAPINRRDAAVIEFIGGEPFIEVELIDMICDYFKLKTYELKDKWYWNYRINICTNGVNYSDNAVQRFIYKNKGKISLTITIDGTKKKHDLQRVFPNGDGSYDIIRKNVDLWLQQFTGNTKVTFAHEDLPLLKESIIELWNIGIVDIAANVVYEDVWHEGDDLVFEAQIKALADYVIDNRIFDKYTCTLFDDMLGGPYTEEELAQTSCGAGKMLAVGPTGNIYPCMRYHHYSLNNKNEVIIGDAKTGIDADRVRAYGTLMYKYQSDEECLNCDYAKGCPFCQGFNYDEAESETNFQRAKYVCKMHKAQVRANNYYFARLYNEFGIKRKNSIVQKKLVFLLSDDYVTYCSNKNSSSSITKMDNDTIKKGLDFAHQNNLRPVFVHSSSANSFEDVPYYKYFNILHIIPAQYYNAIQGKELILVFDKDNITLEVPLQEYVILNVEQSEIGKLAEYVTTLFNKTNRINLNILGFNKDFNYSLYKEELIRIGHYIVQKIENAEGVKEINVLTDILLVNEHDHCGAGDKSITLAPNEKFYICPAFYMENTQNTVGDLDKGKNIPNEQLYSFKFAPLCNACDTYQCENCVYKNKKYTNEVNVSPSFQCKKSHTERAISLQLQTALEKEVSLTHYMENVEYSDPYDNLENLSDKDVQYYNTNL